MKNSANISCLWSSKSRLFRKNKLGGNITSIYSPFSWGWNYYFFCKGFLPLHKRFCGLFCHWLFFKTRYISPTSYILFVCLIFFGEAHKGCSTEHLQSTCSLCFSLNLLLSDQYFWTHIFSNTLFFARLIPPLIPLSCAAGSERQLQQGGWLVRKLFSCQESRGDVTHSPCQLALSWPSARQPSPEVLTQWADITHASHLRN